MLTARSPAARTSRHAGEAVTPVPRRRSSRDALPVREAAGSEMRGLSGFDHDRTTEASTASGSRVRQQLEAAVRGERTLDQIGMVPGGEAAERPATGRSSNTQSSRSASSSWSRRTSGVVPSSRVVRQARVASQ